MLLKEPRWQATCFRGSLMPGNGGTGLGGGVRSRKDRAEAARLALRR